MIISDANDRHKVGWEKAWQLVHLLIILRARKNPNHVHKYIQKTEKSSESTVLLAQGEMLQK